MFRRDGGIASTRTLPQASQAKNYPDALKRDCPICVAKAGEPCCPASLSIPHLARCRASGDAA